MELFKNYLLTAHFVTCHLVNSTNETSLFFFSSHAVDPSLISGHQINLVDDLSLTQFSKKLTQFFAEGGSKVIFSCQEGNATYQQQVSFILRLLAWFENKDCQFLLLCDSLSGFASLLHGALLSFQEEHKPFRYRYLLAGNEFYQKPQIYFDTCFSYGFRKFYLQDGVFSYEQWIPAEYKTISNSGFSANVMIIGGSGAIGQVLAAYLTQRFSCQVFLVGRRPLSDDLSSSLKMTGAKAYFQADISNLHEMQEICMHVTSNYGPIRSIFHLAGVLNDSLVRNKTERSFFDTLNPKVIGSLIIEKLVHQLDIPQVILFSSLSAVMGNIGQSDYAAANAFLNELTQRNNQLQTKTKWFVINWGLWQTETGMQMEATSDLGALSAEYALNTLCLIVANNLAISAVYRGSQHLFAEFPLLYEARRESTMAENLLVSLEEVQEWVKAIIIQFTKFRQLDVSDSLLTMGVDSIIATHIASYIQHALLAEDQTITIAKTLLFQYGSVAAIAEYLLKNFADTIQRVVKPGTPNAALSLLKNEPVGKTVQHSISTDDIAIIGMAGEFPGADNIAEFWQLLKEGHSSIEVIPESRWNWKKQFVADNSQPGMSYCRQGGFIRQAKLFDEKYFNIAPVDAEKMDPQARRLLHQCYYALEDCDFLNSSEQQVGVFCAAMYNHYQNLNAKEGLVDSSFSALANHLSYCFDFKGPSLCVDTMCSGGLTALHLAINALNAEDCQAAIVGGVNIMVHPGKYRFLSEGKFLSPTGKCHSFGVAADGYVPGEGVIVLILKPLQLALRDQNKMYGIIRGSAINAIGRGSAFTVPSAQAQTEVIKKALIKSGVLASDVSYIETHGTGTSLGDPIEIQGLNDAYRESKKPIAIGALKSNIGHLESAAGLASIVKVLLQMHYRTLVPTLNCELENPLLDFKNGPLVLQKKLSPWDSNSEILYAGVSSFGAGGSNAHIILESPLKAQQKQSIKTSIHQFKQKFFWADLGIVETASKEVKEIIPALDVVLLKPSFLSCRAPLLKRKQSPFIYLCTRKQHDLISKNFVDSHASCLVIDDHQAIDEIIQQRDHRQKIDLINVSALDSSQSIKDFVQDQFAWVKRLSQSTLSVNYIYCMSHTSVDERGLERQAYSALYRTLALEKANFLLAVLETNESLENIMQLFDFNSIELQQRNTHYLYQQGQWFRQELEEEKIFFNNTPKPLLKKNGTYLLIGGLGAVGQLIAAYFLQRYQATVIIVGRSVLAGIKLTQLQKLQQFGQSIEYYQADINDYIQVTDCITAIIKKYGRLDGIVHSACVLNDKLIADKTFTEFNAVIESKIMGTLNLDKATTHIDLDFFVLFSSMSSVFGNIGQADYCVANTFLDRFAQLRHQQVLDQKRSGKTIAINWPIWEVEGLPIEVSRLDFIIEMTGISPLQERDGVQLFDRLVDQQTLTQIMPLKGDNALIREKLIHSTKPNKPSFSLVQKSHLITAIKEMIARVTKVDIAELHQETAIHELGFTSVLLIDFASKIEQDIGITVAPSAFFTYNTIAKIADYLSSKVPSPDIKTLSILTEEKAENEAYAIIGLAGLLPGGPEPQDFWQSLLNNQSAIKPVKRWGKEGYFAATLSDIDGFDNKFFGLSNLEAKLMDPQHRLFLQVAYNALLNGGYPPSKLKKVGVFVGVQFNDYHNLLQQAQQNKHPYAATGNSHAMLANRVSYLFDYDGPSHTIDTACSSTLVAINRGILALKYRECDAVLAGAVSLLLDSNVTESANTMGVLSPHYRCATFDEQADGYVRGEGVGCFLIKRLDDALRDKDAIHAVIRGFAENHGGRSHSLTAPNPLAQKALLLKAYNKSLAQQVSYIETHGTGTKLGDPIEVDALNQAFAVLNPGALANSIILGAVKSNVGHLEPAAAVPSLVKVIYALKYGVIPANIYFNKLNPYVQLNEGPFTLAYKNQAWNTPGPRVAGISSFGFGGSNAHLVLMESPSSEVRSRQDSASFFFTLSAKSEKALAKMRLNLANFLQKQSNNLDLAGVSYTLNCCREHFKYRLGFIAADRNSLIALLIEEQTNRVHDEKLIKYLAGEAIDWQTQYLPEECNKVHLPGYSFDNKAFWFDDTVDSTMKDAHYAN